MIAECCRIRYRITLAVFLEVLYFDRVGNFDVTTKYRMCERECDLDIDKQYVNKRGRSQSRLQMQITEMLKSKNWQNVRTRTAKYTT